LRDKRLGAHHNRDRIEAFHWFAGSDAVISGDEGSVRRVLTAPATFDVSA
jgi:hypothetical protein